MVYVNFINNLILLLSESRMDNAIRDSEIKLISLRNFGLRYIYKQIIFCKQSLQKKPKDIDDYISWFEGDVKTKLVEIRTIIRKAAPAATETISYSMPAFKINKVLVYFAGYDHHIGFYPTPSAITKFAKELSGYITSKGAVQFPINQPLPKQLIQNMVLFRVKEDQGKS